MMQFEGLDHLTTVSLVVGLTLSISTSPFTYNFCLSIQTLTKVILSTKSLDTLILWILTVNQKFWCLVFYRWFTRIYRNHNNNNQGPSRRRRIPHSIISRLEMINTWNIKLVHEVIYSYFGPRCWVINALKSWTKKNLKKKNPQKYAFHLRMYHTQFRIKVWIL